MRTYKIIRFYAPDLNKQKEVIKTGLTEEEAKKHCNDKNTHKDGEWFDGYTSEELKDE